MPMKIIVIGVSDGMIVFLLELQQLEREEKTIDVVKPELFINSFDSFWTSNSLIGQGQMF